MVVELSAACKYRDDVPVCICIRQQPHLVLHIQQLVEFFMLIEFVGYEHLHAITEYPMASKNRNDHYVFLNLFVVRLLQFAAYLLVDFVKLFDCSTLVDELVGYVVFRDLVVLEDFFHDLDIFDAVL